MRKGILAVLASLAIAMPALAQRLPESPATPPPVEGKFAAPATGESSTSRLWTAESGCSDCGLGFWMSADYLLWWVKSGPTSGPLITRGSDKDAIPGALGQPGTQVLFGNSSLDFNTFSGLRLQGGVALNAHLAIEGGYFALERRSTGYSITSDDTGSPLIARPFIKQQTGQQDSEQTAFPGLNTGTASVLAHTRFQGWEVNAASNLWRTDRMKLDVLVGFRALDLNEDLVIQDRLTVLVPGPINFGLQPVDPPSIVRDFDRFQAVNHFYGGQIGARGEWKQGPWSVGMLAKLALGTTQQTSRNSGASFLDTPGAATVTLPGGVLALPTNIGSFSRNVFTVVPEGQVNLGYQVRENIKLTFGYSFLYWNHVARPGQQIDRVANPNQIPTDQNFGQPGNITRPVGGVRDSDFWAQGLNFGVEFRY
jgi:hypothetical protein